jgi:hypothetical protein
MKRSQEAMKIKLLPLALLALLGSAEAAAPKISFWVSSFFTDGTYSNFFALSGHTTDGDGPTSDINVSIMPAGSFTLLTFYTFDPGTPGWTRTATLIKNGVATAATCTVPNGAFTCVWTGTVSFADGDLANIKITAGGGLIIKAPWSIMTVFTLGGDDWPWNT